MIAFDQLVRDGARYLEANQKCSKHHVLHTGSSCYVLDFYTALGEVEKGKAYIDTLLGRIVKDGDASVFYPGRLDPMNMSNSVIDSGSAVDAIARFVLDNPSAFGSEEKARIIEKLRGVVETYLARAASEKPITNQRLWGLTGVASFAKLAGEEGKYRALAHASIERAFADSTPDGFFRYYPDALKHGSPAGYDGITEFYQSRHTAFIRYALAQLGVPTDFFLGLAQSDAALLAMYRADGIKDLRLECKRWYWQSNYEVAASGFDTYALATSTIPEAATALHNALYQVREHFSEGYLHSDHGPAINFQCPIFWTAHLAWMLRIPNIRERFNNATALKPFSYTFIGREVFTHTTPERRILIDGHWQLRNPSTGIFDNGLPERAQWSLKLPNFPQGLGFSLRESFNHTWYAYRGLHFREGITRKLRFIREFFVMLLPRYSEAYGKIEALHYDAPSKTVSGRVIPASKYGTLGGPAKPFSLGV